MPPSFKNRKFAARSLATRAITASAQRVLHPNGGLAYRPEDHKVVEWQQQAWNFYDLIGELRYGARYYGNSLSQLRLEIGWKVNSGTAPQPIDLDNPPEGFNRQQYDIAVETLDRLHSYDGSVAEILRQFGVNLFVAGEGYLVGRIDRDTGMERWDFYSTEQLIWLNGGWYLKENLLWRTDQLIKLSDEDYVIRIWQSHPRYSDEPDSPLRSILGLCEELLLLSANVRATALSRIPAGILLMPDTMLDAGPDYEPENLNDDSKREQQTQSALEDIYQHFITPIEDPNSAASVAPFILTGDPEDIERVRVLEFARDMDEIAAQQRQEIITRIAHGVDLPSEILNGMGSVNHWTAWQIEESSYKSHIRPAAVLFCGAITSSLIWPAIQVGTGGEVDQRLVVTFDPIDLISHIDRRLNAKDGHASLVISDATYRKALGFSEEDAPGELEYKRRMALQQAALSLTPVAAGELDSVTEALDESVARVRPGVPTPESITSDPDPRGRTPDVERDVETGEVADVAPSVPEITASASPDSTSGLGRRLVDIDQRLMDRLEILATSAMRRVMEKAGAKIRSKASKDSSLTAAINDTKNIDVASALGESIVASLFADNSLITEEQFDDFAEQYDLLTSRAQKQVRQIAKEYGLDSYNLTALELQQEVERNAGKIVLVGLLVAAASKLLYKPKASSEQINGSSLGEFDDISLVPARVIRAGLSAAGGNMGISVSSGAIVDLQDNPLGLLATGETSLTYLGEAGVNVAGYRWVYGEDDRKEFEPHLNLDGYEFSSWEDPQLTNVSDFPDSSFYFPGDHNGCRCLIEYLFA
jgi:hypothetical protein